MRALRAAWARVKGAAVVVGLLVLAIAGAALAYLVVKRRRRGLPADVRAPGEELLERRIERSRRQIEEAEVKATLETAAARGKEEGLRQELDCLLTEEDERKRLEGLVATMKRIEGVRP